MGFLLCPIRKHYLKQVNSPSNFTSSFFFFFLVGRGGGNSRGKEKDACLKVTTAVTMEVKGIGNS